eukprot:GFUD01041755.1.p1 GENE.GFUD01041755.1~~GFUD01041755.1.p1  ORF type:complete len:471 (+),score=129.63 GFUD01041755.1:46-1458(+)
MYPIEYAPSDRSSCKVCHMKLPKGTLRIGKLVHLPACPRPVPAWFHYTCFWGPLYQKDPGEESRRWSNFKGIGKLSIDDQNLLHQKITGRPLDQNQIEEAEETLEEMKNELEEKRKVAEAVAKMNRNHKRNVAEEAIAAFAECDPKELTIASIEQFLEEMTVPDIKATLKENDIDISRRTKKADLVAVIRSQSMGKISNLAYRSLNKKLISSQLKGVMRGSNLSCSGTKKELILRLLQAAGCSCDGQGTSSHPDANLSRKELGPDIDLVYEEWPLLQPFCLIRNSGDVQNLVENKLIPKHVKWDSNFPVLTSELGQVLSVCGQDLLVLEVGDSGTGSRVDSSAAEMIAKHCPGLQKLSLESCSFNDQEAIRVGYGCPRLRYLKISGHDKVTGNIKDRFLVKIKEERSFLKKLKVLDIVDQDYDLTKLEKMSKSRRGLVVRSGESEDDPWYKKRVFPKISVMKGGRMSFEK